MIPILHDSRPIAVTGPTVPKSCDSKMPHAAGSGLEILLHASQRGMAFSWLIVVMRSVVWNNRMAEDVVAEQNLAHVAHLSDRGSFIW